MKRLAAGAPSGIRKFLKNKGVIKTMQVIKTSIKYSREERETHIWYDPENKTWNMESNIDKHFNRAVKQGWNIDKKFINDKGLTVSMLLSAPENAITIKSPQKRKISEEHKAKLLASRNINIECNSGD